jgi:hypothetical protein
MPKIICITVEICKVPALHLCFILALEPEKNWIWALIAFCDAETLQLDPE